MNRLQLPDPESELLRREIEAWKFRYQVLNDHYESSQAKLATAELARKSVLNAAVAFVNGGTLGEFIAAISAARP